MRSAASGANFHNSLVFRYENNAEAKQLDETVTFKVKNLAIISDRLRGSVSLTPLTPLCRRGHQYLLPPTPQMARWAMSFESVASVGVGLRVRLICPRARLLG